MSQLMRLWYLPHRRPANTQTSLRIRTVSPEPSLFAHMKYGSRQRPKIRYLAHWMAAHARLKNEFTEDEKCHNLIDDSNIEIGLGHAKMCLMPSAQSDQHLCCSLLV